MGTLSSNQVTSLLSLGADAMDNMFDISIEPPKGISSIENLQGARAGLTTYDSQQFKHNLTIRADGFNPPVFKVKTYEVKYKTVTIDRPATKIEGQRQFDITFRLDANYQAYRFLAAWKSLIMQASSGYATNALWDDDGDVADLFGVGEINKVFGKIKVSALARPIHMVDGAENAFKADGVTAGKFVQGGSPVSEGATIPLANELNTWDFDHVWVSELDEPQYKTDGGDAIKIKATFKFGDFKDPTMNSFA